MRHSGRVLVALSATLVLSGCVTAVPAPQPGFDANTSAAFEQQWMDNTWRRSGLPDELRPPDPLVTQINLEDFGFEIAGCMHAAGFANYSENQGGYTRGGGDPPSNDESLALYLCEASLQVSAVSAGVLNSAQLEYWYEYYRLELVPCLHRAGFRLEEVPSRRQFETDGGYWNPYLSLHPTVRVRAIVNGNILDACPPNAPGLRKPWTFD